MGWVILYEVAGRSGAPAAYASAFSLSLPTPMQSFPAMAKRPSANSAFRFEFMSGTFHDLRRRQDYAALRARIILLARGSKTRSRCWAGI
jgi:hypothetical protein